MYLALVGTQQIFVKQKSKEKQNVTNKQTKTTKQQFRGTTGFHIQKKKKEQLQMNEHVMLSQTHIKVEGQNKTTIRCGRLPPTHPLQAEDSSKRENEPKI